MGSSSKISIFTAGLLISFASSARAGSLSVVSRPCQPGSPSRVVLEQSSATAITWKGKSYVVAKAFEFPQRGQSKTCFFLNDGTDSGTPLQFILRDHYMGLSLLALPSTSPTHSSSLFELRDPSPSVSKATISDQSVEISDLNSVRHTMGDGMKMEEILSPANASLDFMRNAGASVVSQDRLVGILSDQSVVLRGGQPSKIYRELDLPLFEGSVQDSFRLAFRPETIGAWIDQSTSENPPLNITPFRPTKVSQNQIHTFWSVNRSQTMVQEICTSETTRRDSPMQLPVGGPDLGGTDSHGTGGLEDLFSNCLLNLSDPFPGGRFRRALLAYKIEGGVFRIQSLLNVRVLVEKMSQSDWHLLMDDFKSENTYLTTLATKARDAATDFYREHHGNPEVIRKAFLFSSLLRSENARFVSVENLNSLIQDLDLSLPLYLRDPDMRELDGASAFAKDKTRLIEQFQLLARELERCRK
jgi:hypothetical protein